MIPLASQEPRPYTRAASSDDGMNGGTVSMWVEKTTVGPRLLRGHREHIAARAFDRHLLRLEAAPEQFGVKEIAHRAFVAGDGLDVYELTGEGDDIHARQDTLVPAHVSEGLTPTSVSFAVML